MPRRGGRGGGSRHEMMANKAALVRIFDPVVLGNWFLLPLISITWAHSHTHVANAALILVFIQILPICCIFRELCFRLHNTACVQFRFGVADPEGRERDEREGVLRAGSAFGWKGAEPAGTCVWSLFNPTPLPPFVHLLPLRTR